MKIEFKENNIITVCEVIFDRRKVKELMKKIADECSFRESGTMRYSTAWNKEEAIEKIKNVKNDSDNSAFLDIDIDSIELYEDSYWEHGDPYHVAFKGVKVEPPRLYFLLKGILCGYVSSFKELMYNYYKNEEMISYKEREEKLVSGLKTFVASMGGVTKESNKTLRSFLKYMSDLQKAKDDNPNYDFDKLREYFLEACKLFSLKEISRTELYEDGKLVDIQARKH